MEVSQVSGGFRENHAFGKYEFRPIELKNEEKNQSILYVGRPSDFHEDVNSVMRVFYLDTSPAIFVVSGERL
jgi:hypothetical protein